MRAGSRSCCGWAGTARCTPSRRRPRRSRALLVGRKLLQAKLLDVELSIRGILRGYGLKVGEVSRGRFEARIRDLIAGHDMLATVIGAMLQARAVLWNEFTKLHRAMLRIARADAVCRRLMSDARRRGAGCGDLSLGGGRSGAVREIQNRRRLLRADAQEVSVRRDRHRRRRHQGRRRDGADRAVRGGAHHADASHALLRPQALGAWRWRSGAA